MEYIRKNLDEIYSEFTYIVQKSRGGDMSIFECVQSVGGACLLPERGTGDGALERVSKFIPPNAPHI